jgi:hypothetical protein
MAQQQIITFDPDVAVPYGVNLTIFSGADFNTTFTVKTSAGSSITRGLSEGRYLYDINVSSGSTFFKIIEGNVLVRTGIST